MHMNVMNYVLMGLLSVVLISCSGETTSAPIATQNIKENKLQPVTSRSTSSEANDCKDDGLNTVSCQYRNGDGYDDDELDDDGHADSSMFTWKYSGFTHTPVDLSEFFSESSVCPAYPSIQPYFNHFIVNHTEGPKKWYLGTCSEEPIKVFMPTTVALSKRGGINISQQVLSGDSDHEKNIYDGNKVIYDVQLWGKASEDIILFFMHITLLDSIYSALINTEDDYIIIEAGTHVGYIKSSDEYAMDYDVIDFGVEDLQFNAGLTDSESWWNHRVNPLDYFTDEIRASIITAYAPIYTQLVEQGTHPFTNLEDSRANINENGAIWGTWFKSDAHGGLNEGSSWAIIHLTKTKDLTSETYWKTLEEHPDLAGILLESKRSPLIGKPLYSGNPKGKNIFFIVSGDPSNGIAKVSNYYVDPYNNHEAGSAYWKYSVNAKSDTTLDDTLMIEVFSQESEAQTASFSDAAVAFRRNP